LRIAPFPAGKLQANGDTIVVHSVIFIGPPVR
jgi:hypothetical protein